MLAGRSEAPAARAGRAPRRARVAAGRRAAPQLGVRAARARRRAGQHRRPVRQVGRAGRARGDRGRAARTSTRPASRRSSGACSRSSARRPSAAGAALLTAMGYDFVPGALAGALALEEAGEAAVRVDVGYYALGAGDQRRARGASAVGVCSTTATRSATARCAARADRPSACARSPSRGKDRDGGVGRRRRAPHAAGRVSAAARGQRLPRLVRPAGAAAAGGEPGGLAGACACRACAARCRPPATALVGDRRPRPHEPGSGVSWVAAEAYDAGGSRSPRCTCRAPSRTRSPPASSPGRRDARPAGVEGTGALGPVQAFGLEALEAGCREAGLERVSASRREPRRRPAARASSSVRGSTPPSPRTRSGAPRGRWNSRQRSASSVRAGRQHRRLGSAKTSHRGAASRCASRIALTARRAASLAPSIVARSVLRAHVVGGQHQVGDPRRGVRAGRPTSRRC